MTLVFPLLPAIGDFDLRVPQTHPLEFAQVAAEGFLDEHGQFVYPLATHFFQDLQGFAGPNEDFGPAERVLVGRNGKIPTNMQIILNSQTLLLKDST